MMKRKICMIVPESGVKGGIAAVVNGYRGSRLEQDYAITYVESYRDGSRMQKLKKALTSYRQFRRVLKSDTPDLVHIHSSFGPSFYRKMPFILMAHRKGIPVLNHIHGSEFDRLYTNAGNLKKKLVRAVWDKCDGFAVLSEQWKDTFSVVIPREKMQVLPNFCRTVEPIDRSAGTGTVVFLGLINEMKGCMDIPAVLQSLRKTYPGARMILCGVGETDRVREQAESLGVADGLFFPGWVTGEEKERILRSADAFFLPSYTEGLPMSILDAMGYSLPVVSTRVGGIPTLVEDGKNGYLCEPGDIAGFSEGLSRLLTDGILRQEFAENACRTVKERYSPESHIRLLESMYEQLCGK